MMKWIATIEEISQALWWKYLCLNPVILHPDQPAL